jgi:hypothetical protein
LDRWTRIPRRVRSLIISNKAATTPINSNELVVYQSISPDTLVLTSYLLIGVGASGQYRKPSQFFSGSGTSETAEQAAAFISYFVTSWKLPCPRVERGIPCSARSPPRERPMGDRSSIYFSTCFCAK